MKDRVEALGEVAWDVLQRMVRELIARKPGGHLIEPNLGALDLRLPLVARGADEDPQQFARELAASIDQQLDEAVQLAAAFRPGHAFCYRCDGASCDHSRPPSCRHVLVGYSPTGSPLWVDFAQHCLDLKHPQVDRLYKDPPAFLALVQDKAHLQGRVIRAFRDGNCEVLGQVTAGFFRVRAMAVEGRGVVALTAQVAASRTRRGRRNLGLNLLGLAPSGEDLSSLWDRHDELPWQKAVQWAQAALQSLSRPGRRGAPIRRGVIDDRVAGILRGLASRLERDQRARSRRTRHAAERHASGERPTRKAVDDARLVRPESCMIDERSDTVVVLGDRGRTHFFTAEGQHVSSVRYSRDAIERKVKLEHWRGASEEELAAFRERLHG